MAASFGLDFGTTNSVVAYIAPDPETGELVPNLLLDSGRPHPSVVWYNGQRVVVGRPAKEQLNVLGLGVFGDIVRSPKMYLGSPLGIDVGGVTRPALDVVADVIRFLREDARARGGRNLFNSAVVTIPVGMRGPARAELRQAAAKAGVHIHQFIHEPLAALYGYLRAQANFRALMASLEGRLALVFDWGGGTLDLTLCHVRDGMLTQVFNVGDRDVGGDFFDHRMRHLVREKHEALHPAADWSRIQPSGSARLIQECEDAKIFLSTRESTSIFLNDVLACSGPEKDVRIPQITREEFERETQDLVRRGLGRIDELLDRVKVKRGSIEFCLATGGMIGMPAVQAGLREMFGVNRLRLSAHASTLIAEGAAWMAYDKVRLRLAKPLELLHANDSYVPILDAGTLPPAGGEDDGPDFINLYCVDPSDGFAKFLFARPNWPGRDSQGDARVPYGTISLPVDRYSRPLLERLRVGVRIDQDLIAEVVAESIGRGEVRSARIHDLEFGVRVGADADDSQLEI
jgi:molecular chaperone DnaK